MTLPSFLFQGEFFLMPYYGNKKLQYKIVIETSKTIAS